MGRRDTLSLWMRSEEKETFFGSRNEMVGTRRESVELKIAVEVCQGRRQLTQAAEIDCIHLACIPDILSAVSNCSTRSNQLLLLSSPAPTRVFLESAVYVS